MDLSHLATGMAVPVAVSLGGRMLGGRMQETSARPPQPTEGRGALQHILCVIAYPVRRWWQLRRPSPHLLALDEYELLDTDVRVYRPQRGWTYRIAYLL